MADIMTEYEALLEEYSDTVTRLCIMHTGNMSDAEDCYQNVFFKLYKQLKKGSIPNPKAWLLRVTVNECRSLWRYRLRRNTLSLEDISEVPAKAEDSELWQLVCGLPPKYRDVIYLYYYEELTAEEIAEITQSKPATVRSQLKRGREKLKGMLEG
ncbi:RNA polymerase sigma factor [uncultured Ruminococcus sp.]|uniref:RNA polymerase sigma factor n=1 Tax=uncultured Ruminococcus sp. TaxID=165186 RepID=UPI0025FE06D1|nr:sigma-70 family RNA polymerase sigma factor [uncultured Ruminococcus sp.]